MSNFVAIGRGRLINLDLVAEIHFAPAHKGEDEEDIPGKLVLELERGRVIILSGEDASKAWASIRSKPCS